ncbi:DNA topoisomerase, partial [Ascosphaera pollenicola]
DSLKNWCILESQKWYQNEIPELKTGEVLEAAHVTSMFSRDQYCSECFFLMWKEKLISPSLDEGHIASLDRQFQKVVEKCAADSPIVKRRNHIKYEPKQDPLIFAKEPSRVEPRDATGTFLELPEGVPVLQGTETNRCAKFYIIQEGDTIDKYCTTLWEGYAICVTEAITPLQKFIVPEVKPATSEVPVPEVPAPAEDTVTDKRHDTEPADHVSAESHCACVDGEEKNACYQRCRPYLAALTKPRISIDGKCALPPTADIKNVSPALAINLLDSLAAVAQFMATVEMALDDDKKPQDEEDGSKKVEDKPQGGAPEEPPSDKKKDNEPSEPPKEDKKDEGKPEPQEPPSDKKNDEEPSEPPKEDKKDEPQEPPKEEKKDEGKDENAPQDPSKDAGNGGEGDVKKPTEPNTSSPAEGDIGNGDKKPENEVQILKRGSEEIMGRKFDPRMSRFIQGRQDSGNETAFVPNTGKKPRVVSKNGKCGN